MGFEMTILLKAFCNLSSAVSSWQKKVTLAPRVFIFCSKNCAKRDIKVFHPDVSLEKQMFNFELTLSLQWNSISHCFFLHFNVCCEMERVLSTEKVEVSTLFRWTSCMLSIIWHYTRLSGMEASRLWVYFSIFLKANDFTFWGVNMNRKVISILNTALKLEHFLCQYRHYVNGHVNYLFAGHINNQYNTCFWMLVKSGKSKSEAQGCLKVILLFILY